VTAWIAQVVAVAVAAVAMAPPGGQTLGRTTHPPLPRQEIDLWLVPTAASRTKVSGPTAALATAVELYQDAEYSRALAALNRIKGAGPLTDYVEYYKGLTQLGMKDFDAARETLDEIVDREPQGAVASAAALAQGEAAEAAADHPAAVAIYRRLAAAKRTVNEDVLSRLGRAALAAGDRKTAAEAYVRIYYEFALTDAATAAASHLARLQDYVVKSSYKPDLGRAAMLFGARRYAEARSAFQEVQGEAVGDDRELVALRIAECDFYLKRHRDAREALRPYLDRASRKEEARFFYLSAVRELGAHDEYVSLTRALVNDFPASSWAEEALNNLGTHYIVIDDDDEAARVFAELYEKFPAGTHAERAAWKAGWWAYKKGDYESTIRIFESAAAAFPRSNYRPSFLYWAARSHGHAGAGTQAEARYRLVFSDYGNSYYGRLARKHVAGSSGDGPDAERPVPASLQTPPPGPAKPPTADLIRLLLANRMYDDALSELRYAQRAWGTSPIVEATIAWTYHQKGELRRAITLMRRAYPQSLTSDGHELPLEIRQVLFPLVYWDLIRKYSQAHNLDPYVVAALIGQESTFDPGARSVANAIGLMQIVPATGRRLARTLGIRRFTPAQLTIPQTNVRLGTLHFSRLVRQFGGAHFALASYNAGENRVIRWKAERPGMDQDEFIDDIPFPETQNYVKRILGTAEDYRMLYGRHGGRPRAASTVPR
jgi:soluble lytic murein transglycosylase